MSSPRVWISTRRVACRTFGATEASWVLTISRSTKHSWSSHAPHSSACGQITAVASPLSGIAKDRPSGKKDVTMSFMLLSMNPTPDSVRRT